MCGIPEKKDSKVIFSKRENLRFWLEMLPVSGEIFVSKRTKVTKN